MENVLPFSTLYIYIYVYLSDERLGANLRVTENRCVLFHSLTYVKKKRNIYIYIYIYIIFSVFFPISFYSLSFI